MIGGQRLGGEDVECGTLEPVAVEGGDERRLVDDAAARDVDQHRAGLHRGEGIGADQPARFRSSGTEQTMKSARRHRPGSASTPWTSST